MTMRTSILGILAFGFMACVGESAEDGAELGSFAAVHTELVASCSPCHSTRSNGTFRGAQDDLAAAHESTQLPASAEECAGMTKGECSAVLIRSGIMPPAGLSPSERTRVADLIDAWVAAGQPPP